MLNVDSRGNCFIDAWFHSIVKKINLITTQSKALSAVDVKTFDLDTAYAELRYPESANVNLNWIGRVLTSFNSGTFVSNTYIALYGSLRLTVVDKELICIYTCEDVYDENSNIDSDITTCKGLLAVGQRQNDESLELIFVRLRGGFLTVGKPNGSGYMTGNGFSFLYPDHTTALRGSAVDGKMLETCICRLTVTSNADVDSANRRTIPFDLVFDEDPCFSHDIMSTVHFNIEVSTADSITNRPLLADPYERVTVCVRPSKIKNAADGLFVQNRVSRSEILLSCYNGIRLQSSEFDKDNWDKTAYQIMSLLKDDTILDIPDVFRSLSNYKATLAHKTNHSFEPNAKFRLIDHPRFGLIPGLFSIKPIESGEEITVNYCYALDECPSWYEDLFVNRLHRQYMMSKHFQSEYEI